jgi:hypothetical protein
VALKCQNPSLNIFHYCHINLNLSFWDGSLHMYNLRIKIIRKLFGRNIHKMDTCRGPGAPRGRRHLAVDRVAGVAQGQLELGSML